MTDTGGRLRLALAHAAVWVVWGSTYLAIRFAIESLPPFLMSGMRFLVAGALVFAFLWARGAAWPDVAYWRSATVIGGLLLLGGNGAVVWAEQTVPSGLVALTVAIVPIWMVLFDWAAGGPRPTAPLIAGLALGFAGVGLLIGPEHLLGAGAVPLGGAAVVMAGSIAWAIGSIYSRTAPLPRSPMMSTALEMLCGGALLSLAGLAAGEPGRFDVTAVTAVSVAAWAYLVVFGSIVAVSAYVYLLSATTPAKATTYAYVNPVIAVFLGWWLAGEPMNARVIAAVAVIVAAVAIIIRYRELPGRRQRK